MKYNFINLKGEIESYETLKEIDKKLNWEKLNRLIPKYPLSKREMDFLNKYGLNLSVWNVAVLQHLDRVYLFDSDLKRLKGGSD